MDDKKLRDLKIIEIDNPMHTGFYGCSVLNAGEEGNGLEVFVQEGDNDDLDGYIEDHDMYIEYDYDKYSHEVTKEVNNLFIETINSLINELFDIEDLFINKLSDELISPKYYNFETDRSFIKIEVCRSKFDKFIDMVFKNYWDQLDKTIYDNHTSYDGFISFYTNDIKSWYNKRYDLDCNELKTVFEMLLNVSNGDDINGFNVNGLNEDLFYELHDICNEVFYNIGYWYESYKDGETVKLTYHEIKDILDKHKAIQEDFMKNQTTFDGR